MEADQQSALGARIARQRRLVCLTQADLAERLGLRQSTISRWETGDVVPSLRIRMRLANELMISPLDLFAEEHTEHEAVA